MHIENVYTSQTLSQMLLLGDPDYLARQQEAMQMAESRLVLPAAPIRLLRMDDRHALWYADGGYYLSVRAEPDETPDVADVTFYRRWHVSEQRMELVRYTHPQAALSDFQTERLVASLK